MLSQKVKCLARDDYMHNYCILQPKNKQYSESDHDALGKACNDEDGDDGGLH